MNILFRHNDGIAAGGMACICTLPGNCELESTNLAGSSAICVDDGLIDKWRGGDINRRCFRYWSRSCGNVGRKSAEDDNGSGFFEAVHI